MKVIIIILNVCIVLFSCNTTKCKVDADFSTTFKKMLSQIDTDMKKQNGLSGNSVRSLFYLIELTNVNSKAIIGDLSYYEKLSDYKTDKRKWKQWYEQNKCLITKNHSNQIMEEVIQSTKWMDTPTSSTTN